jgi:hypothetical protein
VPRIPTRQEMIRSIEKWLVNEAEYNDIVQDIMDDLNIDDISEASVAGIRAIYVAHSPYQAKSKTTKINKISKEIPMNNFTATVITDKSRRLVNIHIEDEDGKFLTPPQELYEAIRQA